MRRRLGFQSELGQILDDAFVKSIIFGFCPAAGLEADLAGRSGSRSSLGVCGSDWTQGTFCNRVALWRRKNGR